MATACNILILHGIGSNRNTNYPHALEENLRREFDHAVRQFRLRDVEQSSAQAKRALRFEVVCWDPVTQKPQDALLKLMSGGLHLLRRINVTYQIRRNMVSLLGDVIAYECDPNNRVYQAIHSEVQKCADRLSDASADERDDLGLAPLTVIGHSLGSVIGSDFIWDHTRTTDHSSTLAGHHFALLNMITLGSPIGLYTLRGNAFGGKDSIREGLPCPVQVEPDHGVWINFYDPQDPVAYPLQPIDSFRDGGVIDCSVHAGTLLTGWNIASHNGYWGCDDVARIVGRKLALDWARINSPAFADSGYRKARERFLKEVRERN